MRGRRGWPCAARHGKPVASASRAGVDRGRQSAPPPRSRTQWRSGPTIGPLSCHPPKENVADADPHVADTRSAFVPLYLQFATPGRPSARLCRGRRPRVRSRCRSSLEKDRSPLVAVGSATVSCDRRGRVRTMPMSRRKRSTQTKGGSRVSHHVTSVRDGRRTCAATAMAAAGELHVAAVPAVRITCSRRRGSENFHINFKEVVHHGTRV